jgi:hypothetical protein
LAATQGRFLIFNGHLLRYALYLSTHQEASLSLNLSDSAYSDRALSGLPIMCFKAGDKETHFSRRLVDLIIHFLSRSYNAFRMLQSHNSKYTSFVVITVIFLLRNIKKNITAHFPRVCTSER